MPRLIHHVITPSEAADRYGLSGEAIRAACRKHVQDCEVDGCEPFVRKSGDGWLISIGWADRKWSRHLHSTNK